MSMMATLEKLWPKLRPRSPGASLTGVCGSVGARGVLAPEGALEAALEGALDDCLEPFCPRLGGMAASVWECEWEREDDEGRDETRREEHGDKLTLRLPLATTLCWTTGLGRLSYRYDSGRLERAESRPRG